MYEIKTYLLPSHEYKMISNRELLELDENISNIVKNDDAYVPVEFYEMSDVNGVSGTDYLYGGEQTDLSDFLLEIILRQKSTGRSYEEICCDKDVGYTVISENDIPEDKKYLCIKNTRDIYEGGEVIVSDLIRVKRYYLCESMDYDEYKERCTNCYPSLFFHKDAFRSIRKLGKLSEIIGELTRHLNALNDYGSIIYDENGRNEENALKSLGSKCNITCSGKGSDEHISFKKQVIHQNEPYSITCNSHTKFFDGYNDQRIYFSWGRDEIHNHRIIVASIGPHWERAK